MRDKQQRDTEVRNATRTFSPAEIDAIYAYSQTLRTRHDDAEFESNATDAMWANRTDCEIH